MRNAAISKAKLHALDLIAREMTTYRFKNFPEIKISRRIKTDLMELIRNAVIEEPEIDLPLD